MTASGFRGHVNRGQRAAETTPQLQELNQWHPLLPGAYAPSNPG